MTGATIVWSNLPARLLMSDQALIQVWDSLNEERGGVPFLDANVIAAALDIFGIGSERLLVGRQDGKIVCMLVLLPQGRFRWVTFQPSQIPLGASVVGKNLSLIEISKSLCRGPLGLCLAISLTQQDPNLTQREPDGSDSEFIDYIDTGWIDITGSFDDYWAARGKNLRQNMKKQRNKLLAEEVEIRMLELSKVDEMAGVIERYGNLESSGWKSERGTAIHRDNDQGRFYLKILEQAASINEALVFEYRFDGKTVAMNLCLFRSGVLIVLKTVYDESISSAFSPAFLLRQEELIKFFGEGKVHRLEYYGRIMEWHTKWTDKKRTLFHLTVYRNSWIKRLAKWRRKNASFA